MSDTIPNSGITVHLPGDLGAILHEAVVSGQFTSADHAVSEIVRAHFRRKPVPSINELGEPADPILGLFRDCPDEIDEIVAEAYRQRREEPWREINI